MALQTSGPISLQNIQGEFGGAAPHSLSEYYGAAQGVPASGVISLSNFYGKSALQTLVISAHQANLNLRNWAISAGWNGTSALQITINSGIWVYSTAGAALTIDGSFPGGLTLINNGYIVGDGGNGGYGGLSNSRAGAAGSPGQTGLAVFSPVTIVNNGTIAGGGGGGGGGGGASYIYVTLSGGGGGGGRSGLANSSNGGTGGSNYANGGQGTAGTSGRAGVGGGAACYIYVCSGAGGSGGNWGANGGAGVGGNYAGTVGGAGGAAGAAVSGNANITWAATGSRYGGIY